MFTCTLDRTERLPSRFIRVAIPKLIHLSFPSVGYDMIKLILAARTQIYSCKARIIKNASK